MEGTCAPHCGQRFNWIFLNLCHQTGASGSLYSVKDYYQINPLFQGEDREPADELLRHFIQRASARETI
jgi:starch synthase (maltosyl-transferring)